MSFCFHLTRSTLPPSTIGLSSTLPKHNLTATSRLNSFSVQLRAGNPDSAMSSSAKSVRVAVAQMTSINDLAANFATCTRLVKVKQSSLQNFASCFLFSKFVWFCLLSVIFIVWLWQCLFRAAYGYWIMTIEIIDYMIINFGSAYDYWTMIQLWLFDK